MARVDNPTNHTDLQAAQRRDPTLQKLWNLADDSDSAYCNENDLLYRQSTDELNNEYKQLILPADKRSQAITVAHSIPMAGHLGHRKTKQRLLKRFYWPRLSKEVKDACKSCAHCHRSARRSHYKAPLRPLPVMHQPFSRIAIDIVGFLPRTTSGHKYLLTMMDYGGRYPDAVPLRSEDAATVATALMSMFTRLGVPDEILTDQGSNFLSTLMEELY